MAMFDAAMFKAWPLAKGAGITSSSVRKCPDYNNGDFQCNAAMSLFKALKVGWKFVCRVIWSLLMGMLAVAQRRMY